MDESETVRGRDVFYSADDGLRLHARIWGEPNGRLPVVCLPGLTRNVRDFEALASILAGDPRTPRQVVAFDYRGRGLSAWDPDWRRYDLRIETADVAAGLTALEIERAAFIGTSRGGLILHLLAGVRPAALAAVVLNDIGPVVGAEGLAHIRSYLERARAPATFAEAVAMQKALHGAAFPALREADWERFVHAIYRDEGGVPVADFDPALLEVVRAMDPSKPAPQLWSQFEGFAAIPLLVVRGANSMLLSEATVAEMARRHPDCRIVTVEGQGHAPFLETGHLPAQIAHFLGNQ